MKRAQSLWFFPGKISTEVLLFTFLIFLLSGCANLPNVQPFTDATISLRSAVASSGNQVVDELGHIEIPQAKVEAKKLGAAWSERNGLLSGLVEYATSLQSIVDSGKNGAESAQALAGSVQKLAQVAGLVQPGAGAAGEAVTQTAVLVYEQVAKARATASLQKALTETQPAIERIALVMADDMGKMDDLVRVALRAQIDELKIANAPQLSYRQQLLLRRDELHKTLDGGLRTNKKLSELTESSELEKLDHLLTDTASWQAPLQAQFDNLAARERLTRQLISETKTAFGDWAAAHSRMLAAVRTRRVPSAVELTQATERIRELVEKFKNL